MHAMAMVPGRIFFRGIGTTCKKGLLRTGGVGTVLVFAVPTSRRIAPESFVDSYPTNTNKMSTGDYRVADIALAGTCRIKKCTFTCFY